MSHCGELLAHTHPTRKRRVNHVTTQCRCTAAAIHSSNSTADFQPPRRTLPAQPFRACRVRPRRVPSNHDQPRPVATWPLGAIAAELCFDLKTEALLRDSECQQSLNKGQSVSAALEPQTLRQQQSTR